MLPQRIRDGAHLCKILIAIAAAAAAAAAQQPMGAGHNMDDMKVVPPPEQLPPPIHMPGVGNAHIAITTSPEVQAWFDQGLNLMHDFWDYESVKAFEQSVRVDPFYIRPVAETEAAALLTKSERLQRCAGGVPGGA